MSSLRSKTKQLLEDRAGLAVRKRDAVPFGVEWTDDLAYYLRSSGGCFVDVGANVGQTATSLLNRFPEAEVHSFEPVPETFERLQRNMAGTSVHAVNSALGAAVGSQTIFLGGDSGLNSFHGSGESIEVAINTLDAYAEEAKLEGTIDLLKIDTEGHETTVLEGASRLFGAGRISHVLTECEFDRGPHEPHGDFFEICDLLRRHDFRVVAFYTEGVDDLGWRWGDVLFRHVTAERAASHPVEEFSGSPFSR